MTKAPGFSLQMPRGISELDATLTAIAGAWLGFLFSVGCLRTSGVGLFGVNPGSFEDILMRGTWAGFSILGALRGYRLRRRQDLIASLAQITLDLFRAALVYLVTFLLMVVLDDSLGPAGMILGFGLGMFHGYLLFFARR